MIELIEKLNITDGKPHLIYFYFNAYLLKKVFFGCRVIKLFKCQHKELRKFCETTIAKNLILGSNFPRAALSSRKNAVRIGWIKPKTAVETLSCKLCIENVRSKQR